MDGYSRPAPVRAMKDKNPAAYAAETRIKENKNFG